MSCLLYVNDEEANHKVDIDELYEKKHQRDLKQLSIFKKILNRIHKRIQLTGRNKRLDKHIWFTVPEYIFGEQNYDQGECLGYLISKLEENGFYIKYMHPNTLFISWDNWIPSYTRNEINKKLSSFLRSWNDYKQHFNFSEEQALPIENKCKEIIKKNNLAKIYKLLLKSKKPIFALGNGLKQSESKNVFKKIKKKLNIPFINTRFANDLFPYSEKLNMGLCGIKGMPHTKELTDECDLIIALGCRFAPTFCMGNPKIFAKNATVVSINNDRNELELNLKKINLKIKLIQIHIQKQLYLIKFMFLNK
jgi:hypothetical protein